MLKKMFGGLKEILKGSNMIKNEEQRNKSRKASILLQVAKKTIKVMKEIREMDRFSDKELKQIEQLILKEFTPKNIK